MCVHLSGFTNGLTFSQRTFLKLLAVLMYSMRPADRVQSSVFQSKWKYSKYHCTMYEFLKLLIILMHEARTSAAENVDCQNLLLQSTNISVIFTGKERFVTLGKFSVKLVRSLQYDTEIII